MKKLLLLIVLILMAIIIFSLDSLNVTCRGRVLFGSAHDLKVQGDNLFFTAGNSFVCADISNSSRIIPVSWINMENLGREFEISGNYAFVTDSIEGFYTIDISDPENIVQINKTSIPNCNMTDAAVTDTILCIANGAYNNVLFYNISDPLNPDSLTCYWTNGGLEGIDAEGQYAYIPEWAWGLAVLDLSDPTNVNRVYYPNPVTSVRNVKVDGIFTYIAAHSNGFYILSNEDTMNMFTLKGSYNTAGYAVGIDIQSDNAYIADWHNGMVIMDITDKTAPSEISNIYNEFSVTAVSVASDRAYTASYLGGIRGINISDKANPQSEAFCMTYGSVNSMYVYDNYIYASNGDNGIAVLSLDDTTNPNMNNVSSMYSIKSIFISEDTLYATASFDGIIRFDIADRANPVYIDRPFTGNAHYITGNSDYLFISTFDNAIKVFNRHSMMEICSYNLSSPSTGIHLENNILYTASWGAGLNIFDVSNPDSILLEGSIVLSSAWDVDVENDYAYVSCYNGPLYIIDISDKGNPVSMNTIPITGCGKGVEIRNDTLYFITEDNGLYIYDVTDKMNPINIGYYRIPGTGNTITLYGQLIAAGCENSGIWICEMTDASGIYQNRNYSHSVKNIITYNADIMRINELIRNGECIMYDINGRQLDFLNDSGIYFLREKTGILTRISVIK